MRERERERERLTELGSSISRQYEVTDVRPGGVVQRRVSELAVCDEREGGGGAGGGAWPTL